MYKLSDCHLIECFLQAQELQLDKEFIDLLMNEIKDRELEIEQHDLLFDSSLAR